MRDVFPCKGKSSPIRQKNLRKAARNLEGVRTLQSGSFWKIPWRSVTSGELQSRVTGETVIRRMCARPGLKLQDRAKFKTETDLVRDEGLFRGVFDVGKAVSVGIRGSGSPWNKRRP